MHIFSKGSLTRTVQPIHCSCPTKMLQLRHSLRRFSPNLVRCMGTTNPDADGRTGSHMISHDPEVMRVRDPEWFGVISARTPGSVARYFATGAEHAIGSIPSQAAKEKYLKGQIPDIIPNAEGWSHNLASASEATVKADKTPNMTIEELQQHTVKIVTKVHGDASQVPHTDDEALKSKYDRTSYPSIKENLERDVHKQTGEGPGQDKMQ